MTRDEAIESAIFEATETAVFSETRQSFLSSLAASGYAVVPVEATEKMCDAARDAADDGRLSDEWVRSVYRAMLTAAQEDSHD